MKHLSLSPKPLPNKRLAIEYVDYSTGNASNSEHLPLLESLVREVRYEVKPMVPIEGILAIISSIIALIALRMFYIKRKWLVLVNKKKKHLIDLYHLQTNKIKMLEGLLHKSNSKLQVDLEIDFDPKETDFLSKLSQMHPNLTVSDKRLALLIRSNLNNHEISQKLFIAYNSVRMAKTRLKKKLRIEGDLYDYIQGLSNHQ